MTRIRLPMDDHWAFYIQALSARTNDDIEAAIAQFTKVIGFHRYGFASKQSAVSSTSENCFHYFHDITGPLGESYKALNTPEIEASEPRILHARNWLPPVSWNSLGQSNYDLPPSIRMHARRKLMITGELGLHSGITIPIHAPGIDWSFITLSATIRTSPLDLVPLLLSASYFANCLQTAVTRLFATAAGHHPQLTVHEKEALRWSALGKTSWEISVIQRVSERTVNYHLYRAAAKLGVKGRRAAIGRAIALDLIRL